MKDSKIKNPLELTSNSNYTKPSLLNSLDINNCLFTPELLAYLLRSNKDQSTYFKHVSNKHSKVLKDKQGIYLIAFRILNKEKKSLVYNYIYYNDMLYLTLLVYFLVRNHFINNNKHEWGKYLVILDNIFLNYTLVDKYFYLHTKNKLRYKS
jgi:hypothetical protein